MSDPTPYSQEEHDAGHRLFQALLEAGDEFAANGVTDLRVMLHGAEMFASVMRRLARDRGAPLEDIKALRALASECARGVYERKFLPHVRAAQQAEANVAGEGQVRVPPERVLDTLRGIDSLLQKTAASVNAESPEEPTT